MLSFIQQYGQAQTLVSDTSTATTTFLKLNINLGNQQVETALGSYYTQETRTDTTTASTSSYPLPDRFVRLIALYVTVGSVQYLARPVYSEDDWRRLQTTTTTSDYVSHVFVRRDTYELYPTPSSSSLTITMIYESAYKFLSNDDYTTGSITTLANGGTSVTASGTAFDSTFVGRYFKVDAFPIWYPIIASGSATTLTLGKKYQGPAISAGTSSYTVGEFPRTPPATHILGVYYAVMMYYQMRKDTANMGIYKAMFDEGLAQAKSTYASRYSSNYIPSQRSLRDGAPLDPLDNIRDVS